MVSAKSKVSLSTILDLYYRMIVAYRIGDSNNHSLVFDMFDDAVGNNPEPIRYSTVTEVFSIPTAYFMQKLEVVGMAKSMSRVAKCIDIRPMDGFWGILKVNAS